MGQKTGKITKNPTELYKKGLKNHKSSNMMKKQQKKLTAQTKKQTFLPKTVQGKDLKTAKNRLQIIKKCKKSTQNRKKRPQKIKKIAPKNRKKSRKSQKSKIAKNRKKS